MSKAILFECIEFLGGLEPLKIIMIDFYTRMLQDTMIGFFFANKDIRAIAIRQAEFLYTASAPNLQYTGKKPAEAHAHLPPILIGHFNRRLIILEQTLQDHQIPELYQKAWIRFERSFKTSIVQKKSPLKN
jgi:truncated hemoglobin YjbI